MKRPGKHIGNRHTFVLILTISFWDTVVGEVCISSIKRFHCTIDMNDKKIIGNEKEHYVIAIDILVRNVNLLKLNAISINMSIVFCVSGIKACMHCSSGALTRLIMFW